tara:strand:- start:3301 stop:3783 length:483 start_codon:yes stop_codon:yes gene_type:complete
MSDININEIFEQAMSDPSLIANLDIEKLLESIEENQNEYLEKTSMEDIRKEINAYIIELPIENDTKIQYSNKLIGYRVIEEIYELHKGKHVRWIRRTNNALTNGGLVVDIKFTDNGTQILCMGPNRRFIQYKFDECITFQKMTETEQLIIMAYDYTKTPN